MEGRWFLLQNGLWLVEKQMPFYQPCIIVVLWRYKYGKIGDCKDNDDSEEFRPFLGDVSFYFSISFGFVWCKWFSSAKMCLNHTRTLHTDSLPTMIPPSYDHHLGILKKMRDFDKKNNKCNKEKYFKTHYKGSQPSAAGQSADWWPTGFSGSCSSQLPKVCKMVSLATSNITITQWLWNHCALEFVFHSVSSYWWYNMLADGWFDWKINM